MNTESPFKSRSGLARIRRALHYSLSGLRAAWQTEHAFRQELLLAAVLAAVALLLPATLTQRALLLGSVLVVLVAELLNSALECVVDRITMQTDELAKRAKDLGSAAVFVALVNLALVWALVLLDVAR